MPYNLVFSRMISSDSVMRIVDVPIPDRNVMIEVLSLISPYRRIAGYAYALRSDGIADYERSSPATLPFGKNRVNFAAATLPYGLEFFPRWGVRSGIISIYTGDPSPPPPPPSPWVGFPGYGVEMRRAQNPSRLEYRKPIGSTIIQSMAYGFIEGCVNDEYLNWARGDGTFRYASLSDLSFEGVTSSQGHSAAMNQPLAVVL